MIFILLQKIIKGVDARIAYKFHLQREENPEKFTSNFINKAGKINFIIFFQFNFF